MLGRSIDAALGEWILRKCRGFGSGGNDDGFLDRGQRTHAVGIGSRVCRRRSRYMAFTGCFPLEDRRKRRGGLRPLLRLGAIRRRVGRRTVRERFRTAVVASLTAHPAGAGGAMTAAVAVVWKERVLHPYQGMVMADRVVFPPFLRTIIGPQIPMFGEWRSVRPHAG